MIVAVMCLHLAVTAAPASDDRPSLVSLVATASPTRGLLLPEYLRAEPIEPLPEQRGSVWWTVGGVAGGAVLGGELITLLGFEIADVAVGQYGGPSQDRARTGGAIAGCVVGVLAGGFGGWVLGNLARDHSLLARIAVIVVDALAVTAAAGVAFAFAAASAFFVPN